MLRLIIKYLFCISLLLSGFSVNAASLCGSDNGKVLTTSPSNLCETGFYVSSSAMTTTNTSYDWICYPFEGPGDSCSATRKYSVTSSSSDGGSISPSQVVTYNATPTFTVTPAAGYVVAFVSGTCGGTLSGNTYTTTAVTANCTVIPQFLPSPCGSDNGQILIDTPSNMCESWSYLMGSTTTTNSYAWSCYGLSGRGVSCSATRNYSVTTSVSGGSGTISGSQKVAYNATPDIFLTPAAGYKIGPVTGSCGGTLGANTYTTKAVTANCTVIASFIPISPGVCGSDNGIPTSISPTNLCKQGTPSPLSTTNTEYSWICSIAGAANTTCSAPRYYDVSCINCTNGTLTLSQIVAYNSILTFTLTPANGFVLGSVAGSCGGTLKGNTFSTNAITANCNVIPSFVAVSPGACGIDNAQTLANPPSNPLCSYGSASAITSTNSDYTWNCAVTGAATTSCAATRSYTITSSVSSLGGSITPSQTIAFNGRGTFTLTPADNYAIGSISGSCGGTLSGNTFTTNPVLDNCTVIASFNNVGNGSIGSQLCGTDNGQILTNPPTNLCAAQVSGSSLIGYGVTPTNTTYDWICAFSSGQPSPTVIRPNCSAVRKYEVISSGSGDTGSISASQIVDYNVPATFTLTPATGYIVESVTGSCGGVLKENTYTTNAVTANCTVIASFTPVINGQCGSDNAQVFLNPPSNLCAKGDASPITSGNNEYTWSCNGKNTGSNASCSATRSYSVATSVTGNNGSISTSETLAYGSISTITLSPAVNFKVGNVTGSCGGDLIGNTFFTKPILANCTVVAEFISAPPGICGKDDGQTLANPPLNLCTLGDASSISTTNTSYNWNCSSNNSGSNLSCSATRSYRITTTVNGGNGAISESQDVAFNATPSITLQPAIGFTVDQVLGTCKGSLLGTIYTINAVSENCTVVASFKESIPEPPVISVNPAPAIPVGTNLVLSVSPLNRNVSYKLCYGIATGNYTAGCFPFIPPLNFTMIPNLNAYVAVQAVNTQGENSAFSNEQHIQSIDYNAVFNDKSSVLTIQDVIDQRSGIHYQAALELIDPIRGWFRLKPESVLLAQFQFSVDKLVKFDANNYSVDLPCVQVFNKDSQVMLSILGSNQFFALKKFDSGCRPSTALR